MQETIKRSEQAIALLFALSRKLKRVTRQARQGGTPYPYPEEYRTQREIEGKQLLLIGLGKLGETIVRKVSGMDLHTAYYESHIHDPNRYVHGIRRVTGLKDAIEQADYVMVIDKKEMSDFTKGYIPQILSWIGKDAFLIDLTGYGQEYLRDIKDSLVAGRLSGAAVTVIPQVKTPDIGQDEESLIVVPQP